MAVQLRLPPGAGLLAGALDRWRQRPCEAIADEAPAFEEAKLDQAADVPTEIERFEVGETPEEPTGIEHRYADTGETGRKSPKKRKYNDDSPVFEHKAAASRRPKRAEHRRTGRIRHPRHRRGPAVKGKGGVGVGMGTGTHPGSGGERLGFGGRGSGSRKAMLGSGGGTKQSERAVAAALNWLARHQLPTAVGVW